MTGTFFTRTNCIALTWTPDREYRAVRIRRTGETVQVEKVWSGRAAEGQPGASCLAAGLRELGIDESCTVAAGPSGGACGFVDLPMPQLPADELKKALRIEISRQLPVNAEKLIWGYRKLPGGGNLLRVAYWREADWQQALDELGALATGVDLVLPPAAALDPIFAGKTVLLPDGKGGLLLTPRPGGGRDPALADAATEGVFGAPPQPLAVPGIVLSQPVAAMPADRQQEYAGALLLAMYAVGPDAFHDRRTLFPVPGELRVPRNRAGRMAALLLGVFLAAATSWLCIQRLIHDSRRLSALRTEAKTLKDDKRRLAPDISAIKTLDLLEKEIQENSWLTRPQASACLADISSTLPDDAWARVLAWNDGKINMEVTTSNKDLDPVAALATSRNLKDVTQEGKRMEPGGTFSIRLNMNAARASESDSAGTPAKSAPPAPAPALTPAPPPKNETADGGGQPADTQPEAAP